MNDAAPRRLSADELLRIARDSAASVPCPACAGLPAAGWESEPSTLDTARLEKVGTLAPGGDEEPTLEEYHPDGTRFWSPRAPIAPDFFPCNRSEVWRCRECGRAFLRYTEYGGYYVEPRIRALDPELICAPPTSPR